MPLPAYFPPDLGRTLDALNAWDALETARQRADRRFAWGPKAVASRLTAGVPVVIPYAGAVIWRRAPGYHGYKTLTLIGVWCMATADPALLLVRVATRRLAYRPPFYDPEAYMSIMRRDYTAYYDDDGSPPAADAGLSDVIYAAAERLTQRRWLAAALLAAALTP